jgi:hypothetical protein
MHKHDNKALPFGMAKATTWLICRGGGGGVRSKGRLFTSLTSRPISSSISLSSSGSSVNDNNSRHGYSCSYRIFSFSYRESKMESNSTKALTVAATVKAADTAAKAASAATERTRAQDVKWLEG